MKLEIIKKHGDGTILISDREKYYTCDVWGPRISGQHQYRTDELANLIVAAPDLLENLEHALTFIELFGDHRHLEKGKCAHCRLIQHMQQAINKAKGITSQTQDQPEPEPSDGDLLLDQMHADAPSPYDP